MNRVARLARRALAGVATASVRPDELWPAQTRAYHQALLLVRAFYFVQFGLLLDQYHTWAWWTTHPVTVPLWPVAWMAALSTRAGVAMVVGGSLLASLAAAMRPEWRTCRVLAALGMLEFAAFWNSFGSEMHGWHAFVFVSEVFVLLPGPRGRHRPDEPTLCERQRFLRVLWYAQAALLATYTLSGAFKLAMAVHQSMLGEPSAFSVDGLARHVAARLFEGGDVAPHTVGPWIIEHAAVGRVLLLGAIYIELCSFIVAFRPRLHRTWAVVLISMHLGIYFVMTIMFSWHVIAVGLLLLCSPFAQRATAMQVLRSLPILGDLISLPFGRSRRSTAPAQPAVAIVTCDNPR